MLMETEKEFLLNILLLLLWISRTQSEEQEWLTIEVPWNLRAWPLPPDLTLTN